MSFITSILLPIYLIVPNLSQTCDEPYQCVNEQMSVSTSTILDYDINGYKSAIGPSTSFTGTNNGRMSCNGAFSCQGISITSTAATYCKGSNACSNTSIVLQSPGWGIFCSSFHTCSSSVLTVTTAAPIRCDGVQSCAFSRIHPLTGVLYATGVRAFYSTAILSSSDLTIELRGALAGYGATLICHTNHTCTINCHALDSCYMFYIECDGTCIVNVFQNIAPITNISEITIDNTTHFLYTNTAHVCNNTYDTWEEAGNSDIEKEGPICCRARDSCSGSNITSRSVTCSGSFSCTHASIHADQGSVFCESADACRFSHIYSASHLYCWAIVACSESIITAGQHIVCAGRKSCETSVIYSGGYDLDIYFTGESSGKTATIYCNQTDRCNIVCAGYSSCEATALVCDGMCDVSCDASSQCPVGWTSNYPTVMPSRFPIIVAATTTHITVSIASHSDQPIDEIDLTAAVIILASILICIVILITIWYCKSKKSTQIDNDSNPPIRTMSVSNDNHNPKHNPMIIEAGKIQASILNNNTTHPHLTTATKGDVITQDKKAANVADEGQQSGDDDLYCEYPKYVQIEGEKNGDNKVGTGYTHKETTTQIENETEQTSKGDVNDEI
eukprot:1083123_1